MNRRYQEGIALLSQGARFEPASLGSARAVGRQSDAPGRRAGGPRDNSSNATRAATRTPKQSTRSGCWIATRTSTLTKPPTPFSGCKRKKPNCCVPISKPSSKRAIATYEKKYQLKLKGPVQLEVYPDHEDFAVRTMGMPGLGALGVTFGSVVAMDSPSGRPPGTFHWASTMWHELSHVFVLQATNHRVPRWFTEGMAVYEETAAAPDWGDRLDPEAIEAIRDKKLLPVAETRSRLYPPQLPGASGRLLFPGRQDLRLHRRKVGLREAPRHDPRPMPSSNPHRTSSKRISACPPKSSTSNSSHGWTRRPRTRSSISTEWETELKTDGGGPARQEIRRRNP